MSRLHAQAGLISIEVDPAQERALRAALAAAPRAFNRAMRRAVNKTGRAGRLRISKLIRQELVLEAAAVRDRIRIRAARGHETTATITISRKAVPLKDYGARETRGGVTVKVRRQKPRERLRHAFIAESLGHHVFERQVRGGRRVPRLPIEKQYGPTVLGVLEGKPGLLPQALKNIDTVLRKRMEEEVNFELLKLSRRR